MRRRTKAALLILAAAAILGVAAAPAPPDRPVWAVDPEDPGEDLPPAGRSLFDHLFTADRGGGRVYDVPFPFADLVRTVEERLGAGAGPPALERVLIPLGRSLQRNAAAPRFFAAPRAVLAAVADPGRPGAPLLKDRLYIAYQETAAILEVISYNETAGRFELQVVRDYRPGGRPRVLYASRALCSACHQNAGPIFARQLWDETNANPRIVRLLREEKRDFYGFPVDLGPDAPYAVQAAAERANRFALDQRLWREGCDAGGERALRCRAALFAAVLQYRLTGGRFDAGSAAWRDGFLAPFAARVDELFPHGLAVPDPDLPNRDPFAGNAAAPREVHVPGSLTPEQSALLGGVVLHSTIPAAFEPLHPRPPLETWTLAGSERDAALERLVSGLAGFLAESDVQELDGRLLALGGAPGAARHRETAGCRLAARRAAGGLDRLKLDCRGRLTLRGRIFLAGGRVTGGEIETVAVDGSAELADLAVQGGTLAVEGDAARVRLVLVQKDSGRRARRPSGDAVEALDLTWRDGGGDELEGRAELTFLADFAAASRAIESLVRSTAAGTGDALGSAPFRRAALLPPLLAWLGAPSSAADASEAPMPPPELDALTAGSAPDAATERLAARFPEPALKAFVRYCSACHAGDGPAPPSFLHGEPAEVRARIGQCAERIYFRLGMWQLPDADRPKQAMPPVRALRHLRVDPERWPLSAELLVLRRHVADLLREQTGAPPRLEDLKARGYESLRDCLGPAPTSPAAAAGSGGLPGRARGR